MHDSLRYRLPNGSKVMKTGWFHTYNDEEDFYGFVIKPFEGDTFYGFKTTDERTNAEDFVVTRQEPICYSKDEYLQKAQQYLNAFEEGDVSKAIFSRIKKVPLEHSPVDVYEALCEAYPEAFVYLISSPAIGTWIGASPEVFVTVDDEGDGRTMALAGTKAVGENREWTSKEREEQQYVTDYILEHLNTSHATILNQSEPKTVTAGPVEHIRTDFKFFLLEDTMPDFIKSLHPTPAVCGVPKLEAYKLIRTVESHDRELYTGFIGFMQDTTELYVNLRCAQVIGNEIFLYLGGGFTKDSNPEKEWIETENKAKTLLNIIEKL